MISLLKYLTKKEVFIYFVLVLVLLGQVFFTIFIPDRIANVVALVDGSFAKIDINIIVEQCLLLFFHVIGLAITIILSNLFSTHIAAKYGMYIRHEMFVKANNIPLQKINELSVSSIIWRSTSDIDYLQILLQGGMTMIITAPGVAFGGLVKMLFTQPTGGGDGPKNINNTPWQFIVLTTSVIIIMTVITLAFAVFILPIFKRQTKNNEKLLSLCNENIRGIKIIKSSNSFDLHKRKYLKVASMLKKDDRSINIINALANPAVNFFVSCSTIGIYWLGAYLIDINHLNPDFKLNYSDLIGYATLSSVIIGSFVNIVAVITILPQISVITKRINEILKSSDEDMNIDIVNRTNKKGVIEFKNVSFKYNDAVKNVLNEINFKIDAGEIVGIIGPMGSGKTTLINLIPSLLKPTSGTILVDGIDIKKSNLVKLRRKIGYSSQNSYILNATVKENISPYENKNLRFDKMRLIAKISNADNFINKLEGGYNSILLRGGNNLSGGQKQRISITRSISKDNEILLFDDSFSALDYANDLDIRNKISKKYKKATKIIVATRISTIINADKIILLNEGKIIDIGKHNELFKRCKQYKNLVLSQITLKEAKNA